ncbi:MAG: carboxypeptidase regulatory-like protein [Gemmataceae bacterium]|nr:carboxypeptidase regulatory-like protein [Gemmataceae bacterium]
MKFVTRGCGFIVLALAPLLAGCGKENPVKVSGTVTLKGQPVEGASVQFVPVAGGGRPAAGTTQTDGGFSLTTFQDKDGALPGEYKVVVVYNPPVRTGPAENTEQGMKQAMQLQEKAKKEKPKYVIPAAYSHPSSTPVNQSVPADGPVTIDIK